jgi:hypothetical protein
LEINKHDNIHLCDRFYGLHNNFYLFHHQVAMSKARDIIHHYSKAKRPTMPFLGLFRYAVLMVGRKTILGTYLVEVTIKEPISPQLGK